ncbi:MAG TPA: hypothetical protein VME22_05075 [Solirubrobacteraceae bacterium]|nr:hypothetical protein [Solirubrobacteraceae bacterium]
MTRRRDGRRWQIGTAAELPSHPLLGPRTRRVGIDEEATPPGHESL